MNHNDDLPEHATQWFGPTWGAPVCREDNHVPTPAANELCEQCRRGFSDLDQGFRIAHFGVDEPVQMRPWHKNCFLGTILPEDILKSAAEQKAMRGT